MSKVRKNSAILKRAITEKHTGWSRRDWNSKPKNHWRSSAVDGAGQSSNLEGKLKDISLEMDALGSALKEQTHTWNRSCKESAKKETELFKMIEPPQETKSKRTPKGTSSRKHLNNFVKRKTKQMRLVPCWMTCSNLWTKPTQKSLEPDVVLIVKSTSTCTRGTKNLDDHTFPWQKSVANDAKQRRPDDESE